MAENKIHFWTMGNSVSSAASCSLWHPGRGEGLNVGVQEWGGTRPSLGCRRERETRPRPLQGHWEGAWRLAGPHPVNPALPPRGQGHQLSQQGGCEAWAGTVEGQDKRATGAGTWKPRGLEVSSLGCRHPAFPPQDHIRRLSLPAIGRACPLEPPGNPLGIPRASPSSMQVTGPDL